MKALVLAAGTRGDVLPALALAERLSRAGHDVVMYVDSDAYLGSALDFPIHLLPWANSLNFEGSQGLSARRLKLFFHALGLITYERSVLGFMEPLIQSIALHTMDLVIYTPIFSFIVYPAKSLGLLSVALHYQPCFPTGSHPSPYLSASAGPSWFNRLTFELVKLCAVLFTDKIAVQRVRSSGGRCQPWKVLLDQSWKLADLHLQAFSPTLTEMVPGSCYKTVRTGALRPRASPFSKPSERVAEMIKKNSLHGPVVYFGVSRPAGPGCENALVALAGAVKRLGGILLTNLGDLRNASLRNCCVDVSGIDHSALFPMVDLAILEGGAGTCHAAALCAVPMVIIPYWFDQFIWCDLLVHNGLAYPVKLKLSNAAEGLLSILAWAQQPYVKANLQEKALLIQMEGDTADAAFSAIEASIDEWYSFRSTSTAATA